MKEVWKDIKGFSGKYKISNIGRIKSFKSRWGLLNKPRFRKISYRNGYLSIRLMKNNYGRHFRVHRLLAGAFIKNKNLAAKHVAHKDGNPLNNRLENLYWATPKQNMQDRSRHGRTYKPYGSGKLNKKQVLEIRNFWEKDLKSPSGLALIYQVNKTTIKAIIKRKVWAHI